MNHAHVDNPEEMVRATQQATIEMLKGVIAGLKLDIGETSPGMTWEQIDHLLEWAGKKEPTIIFQDEEM